MREHQITITLQAEQFQEIQRLARTAGARSVGTFAREKLLATLGLNLGSRNLKATRAQDLTSVTGELKRLHRELQIFIAESLSTKDYGYVVNGPEASESYDDTTSGANEGKPNQQSTAAEVGVAGALQDYGQSAREAEDLAERAFIISPRLGAIEEVSDEPMSFVDPLDELLGEFDQAETPALASSLLSSLNLEQIQEPAESRQKDEDESKGGIPHSVYDAELAAFQKEKEELQKASNKPVSEEAQDEPATPVSATLASADEEVTAQPKKTEDDVNSEVSTGIQEDSVDSDFQNRPPLSGGPPPRKRRT